MKSRLIYIVIVFSFSFILNIKEFSASELSIYTYNSFNSDWGPGPIVFKKFEKMCDCTIKIISSGDSGKVLNRVILEKENPRADILLGLNNSEIEKAMKETAERYMNRPKKRLKDITNVQDVNPIGYFGKKKL